MGHASATARNAGVDAEAALVTHGTLYAVVAITGITGTASTDTFSKSAAHGLTNGDPVLLTAMTGGSGLTAGSANNADGNAKVYFVIEAATTTFKLALDPSGSAVNFTTDVSAVTVNLLYEIVGGSPTYARKALSFAASSGGVKALSASPVFDVPASTTIGGVGYYTAASSGTRHFIDGVVFETFSAQGTYTLTSGSISVANA